MEKEIADRFFYKFDVQIGNLKVVDKGATIKGIVSALDRIGDWVIKRIDAIIDPLIEKQLEKEDSNKAH